ncbi:hypothetical protein BHM03_00012924 [Ensete ventricosum]|nr:hypothetical protein BHM03_00012924 [Ensete ventricosum]
MTSSESSSSIRIIPSPGSGGTGLGEPEVSSSGASSGPPSSIDARVLRDLEVTKAGHDMDTVVTEGSLAAIRERYSIPTKYELHVLWPAQRPYGSYAPGVCISVDALEAGLRFPLHPCWETYNGCITCASEIKTKIDFQRRSNRSAKDWSCEKNVKIDKTTMCERLILPREIIYPCISDPDGEDEGG